MQVHQVNEGTSRRKGRDGKMERREIGTTRREQKWVKRRRRRFHDTLWAPYLQTFLRRGLGRIVGTPQKELCQLCAVACGGRSWMEHVAQGQEERASPHAKVIRATSGCTKSPRTRAAVAIEARVRHCADQGGPTSMRCRVHPHLPCTLLFQQDCAS